MQVIDVDIFACVNAFEYAHPDSKSQSLALIDFGAVDTTIAILNKGTVTFSRDIAFGGNDLTEMIQRKLNLQREEALKLQLNLGVATAEQLAIMYGVLERLYQEITSSLNYYYSQHQNAAPIDCLYISGGFSELSFLAETLEKSAQIPVKKWDPLRPFTLGQKLTAEELKTLSPFLPVSIGLALRSK